MCKVASTSTIPISDERHIRTSHFSCTKRRLKRLLLAIYIRSGAVHLDLRPIRPSTNLIVFIKVTYQPWPLNLLAFYIIYILNIPDLNSRLSLTISSSGNTYFYDQKCSIQKAHSKDSKLSNCFGGFP